MNKVHFHVEFFTVDRIFTRRMEVELLQSPGLIIKRDRICRVWLFDRLNRMAVIGQRDRAIDVMGF
ncbi:hypothetical protein D3C87_1976920 [compost metagenome]